MRFFIFFLFLLGSLLTAFAPTGLAQGSTITAARQGAHIVYSNGIVTMRFDRQTGSASIEWKRGASLSGIAAGAQIPATVRSTQYLEHQFDLTGVVASEGFGRGRRYTIANKSPGLPDLIQQITFYEGEPFLLMQTELRSDQVLHTNHIDALIANATNAEQALIRGCSRSRSTTTCGSVTMQSPQAG